MSSLLRFVDAAYAGAITGGPYDGACFYLPGGDAFHAWPLADVHGRPERYRLPVWVRSNPDTVDPSTDARACLKALDDYNVPPHVLVALDSETSIDAAWVRAFVDLMNAGTHPVIDYGSQSTVFGNDNPDGYYWGADWTDVPHLASGDDITQYASFRNQDLDLASSALPFWDTRPGTVPVVWTEFDMSRLPILRQGDADRAGGGFWYVRRLQSLVHLTGMTNGLGGDAQSLPIDGIYGPHTANAVRQVQHLYGITNDGVAGPQTWSVLLTGAPG